MPPTDEELLALHEAMIETVRTAVSGLGRKSLHWQEPDTKKSIASELVHLFKTERWWMREAGFDSQLKAPPSEASLEELLAALEAAAACYRKFLSERPGDATLRRQLLRLSQHAIYHLPRLYHFRVRQGPHWPVPPGNQPGSWAKAADRITELILKG
ncbi:MAG: hypothetical protein V1918_07100 [Planctomycetota bacterium]